MTKKGEATKHSIIEKASDLFNVKGIAGTSIEDVLAFAKVTRGCLLGHFRNKEELVLASTDYLLNTNREPRLKVLESGRSAKEKIWRFIDMHKQPLRTPVFGGCPIMNLSVEADDTNPGISKVLRKEVDDYTDMLIEILEAGKTNHEFSGTLEPEEFAYKMFTAIEGALLFCRIKNSQRPMKAVISSLKKELESFCI